MTGFAGIDSSSKELSQTETLPHPLLDGQTSTVKLVKYLFNPYEPSLSHRGRTGSSPATLIGDDWQDLAKKLMDENVLALCQVRT